MRDNLLLKMRHKISKMMNSFLKKAQFPVMKVKQVVMTSFQILAVKVAMDLQNQRAQKIFLHKLNFIW